MNIMEKKRIMKNFYQRISNFVESKYKLIFVILLIFAFIFNLYKIDKVPNGVNLDEAGLGVDVYSIANYGTDRNMNKFPVYFQNFGEGQSALYIYLAAILVKMFGFSVFILRMPALILSVIEVGIIYLLIAKFKSRKFALFVMFLTIISPWHFMKSRWALDAYLLSPMLVFSIYVLVLAIERKSKLIYAFAGTLFGVTLYSYAISYITEIFMFIVFGIYFIKNKKIGIWDFVCFIIPFMFFAIPLILMQLVQYNVINPINSFISCNKLPNTRGHEMNLNVLKNIGSLKNVFIQDIWIFNSIPGFGTIYVIGLIFVVGFVISLKDAFYKKSFLDFLMNVWFFSGIIWCLVVECNVNRLNGVYIPIMYYIGVVVKFIIDKGYYKLFYTIFIIYIVSFIMFVNVYFKELSKDDIPLFDNGMIEFLEHIKDKYGDDKNVYFDMKEYNYWVYEPLVDKISPEKYFKTFKRDGSFNVEVGRYHNGEFDLLNIDDNGIYILNNSTKEKVLIDKNFKKDDYEFRYNVYYK